MIQYMQNLREGGKMFLAIQPGIYYFYVQVDIP